MPSTASLCCEVRNHVTTLGNVHTNSRTGTWPAVKEPESHLSIAGMDDRVREVIRFSGLTQVAFAKHIGIDGPKLSKSLVGIRRWHVEDLLAVAGLGETTVDWLLTGRGAGPTHTAARLDAARVTQDA